MNDVECALLDPSDRAKFIIDELSALLGKGDKLTPATAVSLYQLLETEFDDFCEIAYGAGYRDGSEDGFKAGDLKGYTAGYENGAEDQLQGGCDDCYREGYEDGCGSMVDLVVDAKGGVVVDAKGDVVVDAKGGDLDFSGDPTLEEMEEALNVMFSNAGGLFSSFGAAFVGPEFTEAEFLSDAGDEAANGKNDALQDK